MGLEQFSKTNRTVIVVSFLVACVTLVVLALCLRPLYDMVLLHFYYGSSLSADVQISVKSMKPHGFVFSDGRKVDGAEGLAWDAGYLIAYVLISGLLVYGEFKIACLVSPKLRAIFEDVRRQGQAMAKKG